MDGASAGRVPLAGQRVKGKQVEILCDLVTVMGEKPARRCAQSLSNREGGRLCRSRSQETCRPWVQGAQASRITRN